MLYSVDRIEGFMVNSAPAYHAPAANHDVFHPQRADSAKVHDITPSHGVRHISEELWNDAKKRHCDARASWRGLLNKYVQPH